MSGYWDAVNRASLGLPGTADPRPRSRFEGDDDPGDVREIDAVERELAASLSPVAPTGAPSLHGPTAATAPAQPKASAEQRNTTGSPASPPASSPPVIPSEREGVAQKSSTHGEAPSEILEDRPQETPVATVEIHRIETTRTVVESSEGPAPPVIREELPAQSTAAEPVESLELAATPLAVAEPETLEIVIATPLALPSEPAPPPPVESAPLIIDIGRIDIRIASEAAPTPVPFRRGETGSVPSLNAYLARRSEVAQ